ELIQNSDVTTLKNYMEFKLLHVYADALDEDFEQENFKFAGQNLYGLKEQKPQWKRTIGLLDNNILNNAIAPMYCREHFNDADKQRVMGMVADITEAFRERVMALDWMTDQTKQLTLRKLDNIVFKMGFPDTWTDTSSIDISADSFAAN